MGFGIKVEAVKAMGSIEAVIRTEMLSPEQKMLAIEDCLSEYKERAVNKGLWRESKVEGP